MDFPVRVRRGSSSNDYYFWDGSHEMTYCTGGGALGTLGQIMWTDFSIPLVTMTTADFDALQDYLSGRRIAFDTLTAQAVVDALP